MKSQRRPCTALLPVTLAATCDQPMVGSAVVQYQLSSWLASLCMCTRPHAIALVESGEVWCWGCNAGHQLGDGTRFDRATSVQASLPPQKVVAIATPREAPSDGSFALSEGGECWTCKLRLHTLCLLVTFTRH